MRAVIQRVKKSKVSVDNKTIGSIANGLLVLFAVHVEDTENLIKKMADKIINMRIFEDDNQKMNLSVKDTGGEIMVISQFTLYGDSRKGNRPSFIKSARPDKADLYYNKFIEYLRSQGFQVETGKFGEFMEVELVNSGPTTIILDV